MQHITLLNKSILQAYPDGVLKPCALGWLPIHYVMNRQKPDMNVVRYLVDIAPDTLMWRTHDGQTPLHILLDRYRRSTSVSCGFLVVHNSVWLYLRYRPSKKVIEYLLLVNPAIVSVADKHGYLPLHMVLDGSAPQPLHLVRLLLQKNLDTIKIKTLDGFLPLHTYMSAETMDAIYLNGDCKVNPSAGKTQDSGLSTLQSPAKRSYVEYALDTETKLRLDILNELVAVYPGIRP
jgi:ankyrin repeat protein